MHSIEQPHDDSLRPPSEVWENLSPERRESTIRLLAKLAYEIITTQRKKLVREENNELSIDDE